MSLDGRQFSDSPRAVYEELVRRGGTEVEHIWTQDGGGLPEMPSEARVVGWGGSREWYEALARSRYVVVNSPVGDWFVTRPPGQRVVQTWHGTPLKKIGKDLLGTPQSSPAYIAGLPHSYRQFDFVVSPNAYTTEIMRRAYSIERDMLESGYPRNDVFHAPRPRSTCRASERAAGPARGQEGGALRPPTWREDQRHASNLYKLDLRIDLAAAQAELGHDHVLLFRKHPPRVHDNVPGAGRGFVWDVTRYPDIADLYLVADVLVTDYSSALFDFAHSGKPMLFFTYDLEHYRDSLRGLYFDFTTRAPARCSGPPRNWSRHCATSTPSKRSTGRSTPGSRRTSASPATVSPRRGSSTACSWADRTPQPRPTPEHCVCRIPPRSCKSGC